MRKILAIDPGNEFAGVIEVNEDKTIGTIKGKFPNSEVLEIVKNTDADEIACEFPIPRGMPASLELFLTVVWIGRYQQIATQLGIPFHFMDRSQIKLCICGQTRAKDGNVRAALLDIYGEQGNKKNPGPTYGITKDTWAALAVGYTFLTEGESLGKILVRREEKKAEKKAKRDEEKAVKAELEALKAGVAK